MAALDDIPHEGISETENEMSTRLVTEIDKRVFECVREKQA
jgi:hypothetical protein